MDLRHANVVFALVVGEGNDFDIHESEHIVLVRPKSLEQVSRLRSFQPPSFSFSLDLIWRGALDVGPVEELSVLFAPSFRLPGGQVFAGIVHGLVDFDQ